MSWTTAFVTAIGIVCLTVGFCTYINRNKPKAERCSSCQTRLDTATRDPLYE